MIDTTTHVEDRAGVPVTRRDLDELEEKLTSDAAGLGVWIATLEERIATLNGVWDLAAEALERQFEAERDFLRDALAERDTAIAALQRRVDQLDAERLGWLGELRQLGIRHDMLAERICRSAAATGRGWPQPRRP